MSVPFPVRRSQRRKIPDEPQESGSTCIAIQTAEVLDDFADSIHLGKRNRRRSVTNSQRRPKNANKSGAANAARKAKNKKTVSEICDVVQGLVKLDMVAGENEEESSSDKEKEKERNSEVFVKVSSDYCSSQLVDLEIAEQTSTEAVAATYTTSEISVVSTQTQISSCASFDNATFISSAKSYHAFTTIHTQTSSQCVEDVHVELRQIVTQLDLDEDDFDPILFIRNLPPQPAFSGTYVLPPSQNSARITLILDLDETLVHCSTSPMCDPPGDITFPILYNDINYSVSGRFRPGWKEFLEQCAQLFEVVVFTASQKIYADSLLDIMDPKRELIAHRLFRDSCVNVDGNFLKDLQVLGRDLSKVIIVDNSIQAFAYHIENGIPISSWYDNPDDTDLAVVGQFLEKIYMVDDVRPFIRQAFGLLEKIWPSQQLSNDYIMGEAAPAC